MGNARRTRIDPALVPASPNLDFEQVLWEAGARVVAGIDEAGRGALAGPVACGAVILPCDVNIMQKLAGVRDSKEMTPDQREFWAERIRKTALAEAVGYASSGEIDAMGILPATALAAARALQALKLSPEHLLLDYIFLPDCDQPQTALIKGDQRSLSIAAASVLAKTSRDELLRKLDQAYPGYGFAVHKGYGTALHLAALERLGPTPAHRFSFQPVRKAQDQANEPSLKDFLR